MGKSKAHIHFAANNILANRIEAPEKQRHDNKVEDVSDEKLHDGTSEEDVSVGTPIRRLSGRKQGITNGKNGKLNQRTNQSRQLEHSRESNKAMKDYNVNAAADDGPNHPRPPLAQCIRINLDANHKYPQEVEAHANQVHSCGF